LTLDARYERVREAGVIRIQAVLLAIGIAGTAGAAFSRSSSPTARAARAGGTSLGLRKRGLSGVEFVVSDDHAGLRQAIVEVLRSSTYRFIFLETYAQKI
jgi:putative transposase